MKYLKFSFLISILFSLFVQTAYGQVGLNKLAQTTMNFQLVSISPKASAMGEAFVAIGKGAESIFFNPAGLDETARTFDVTLNMTQWIADINYYAGAVTWALGLYGTVGISMMTVDYGTIYGTSLVGTAEQQLYPLGYKDNGEVSNVGAYSVGLSYGKAISDQFLIGGNARLVGQNLGENILQGGEVKQNNASKLVFDAGVKYYTGFKSMRFGMAIRNFSSNVKREVIDEQLPLLFTMGLALDLLDIISPNHTKSSGLTIAIDYLHPNNYSERVNLGIEYILLSNIAFRGGYQTNRDIASWSAGIGLFSTIGNNDIEFNYSYSALDIFDNVNRFSLGIAF